MDTTVNSAGNNVVRVVGTNYIDKQVIVVCATEYILNKDDVWWMMCHYGVDEYGDPKLDINRGCVLAWLKQFKSAYFTDITDFEADITMPSGDRLWSPFIHEDSPITFDQIMFGIDDE